MEVLYINLFIMAELKCLGFTSVCVIILTGIWILFLTAVSGNQELNLIVMLALTNDGRRYSGSDLQGAAYMAKRDIIKNKMLDGYDLNMTILDVTCTSKSGLQNFIELKRNYTEEKRNIHGVIGPQCTDVCYTVGFVTAVFDILHESFSCEDSDFDDAQMFPTLVRSSSNHDTTIPNLITLLVSQLHLVNLAIISTVQLKLEAKIASLLSQELKTLKKSEFDVKVVYIERRSRFSNLEMFQFHVQRMLHEVASVYKVFFLLTEAEATLLILQGAKNLSMFNGDHLFITSMLSAQLLPTNFGNEGYLTDQKISLTEATALINGLIIIDYYIPHSKEYDLFIQQLSDSERRSGKSTFTSVSENRSVTSNHSRNSSPTQYINSVAALMRDSIKMWAYRVNATISQGLSITEGSEIVDRTRHFKFEGLSGIVNITSSGGRYFDWLISVVQNKDLVTIGEYCPTKKRVTLYDEVLQTIVWPGGRNKIPGAEKVLKDSRSSDEQFYGIIFGFVFAVIVIVPLAVAYIVRRGRLKMALDMVSRIYIQWSDINIYCGGKLTEKSEKMDEVLAFNDSSVSHVKEESGGSFQSFVVNPTTAVGYYQEKKVVVKMTKRNEIDLKNKQILLEFVQMQKLHHGNLNAFIGVCVEKPDICICMAYCSKGSLSDVISRRTIRMTWDFRMAIALDIAKGMEYLHSSQVASHGHLTSTNCVIDGSWTCKITDYGLCNFRLGHLINAVPEEVDEDDEAYLWTAPELLRVPLHKRPLYGTKPGDVYSFAIIIQEICFQQKPFGTFFYSMGPATILDEIKAGKNPPLRPVEPFDKAEMPGDMGKFSPKWLTLMDFCWNEVPDKRPHFLQIKKMLQDIHERKPVKAVDNMVKMLETYTTRLENIVYERHQLVVDEKKKADTLLYSILPKVVAEQLKDGKKVLPEQFDSVTIFVSDIVKFTPLAAASTPLQVITLLGVLYNSFDEIIDRNGVYKVETIGDAYVVASGLPVRNGSAHAAQIATFALDILNHIIGFRIPYMPERKLEIRIGLHTGLILAGVVGLKMPRYCLFGKTLETANLMEVTCPANTIHVSDTTRNLLVENGFFILTEFESMDYENKTDVMTYQLQGRSLKRLTMTEGSPKAAVESNIDPRRNTIVANFSAHKYSDLSDSKQH